MNSPEYERVADSLARQGMMRPLGVRLLRAERGLVELAMPYSEQVTQQQGGFHGGAMGALADIAGGYAGLTVLPEGMEIVTVEYKINFLAPGFGEKLIGRGRVIRPGRTLHVCVADIFAVQDGAEKPVAYMTTTMMAVPDPKLNR